MKILKFGGSSVASPERIKLVSEILKGYLPGKIAVVFSAFGGITDQLIKLSTLALEGNEEYRNVLNAIARRHHEAIRELMPVPHQEKVIKQVDTRLKKLENIAIGIYLVRERTPRTLDYVMSFGERLAASIISESLNHDGVNAQYLDARKLIRTDNHFGNAKVDFEITNLQIKDYFNAHPEIQIITGFIATAQTGETTTLGRSGSDYTAAIFAGALQAEELEIWTDVDGMMTADPRLVKKSFTLPEMSYEEAMELSHFGAKVIFPTTMLPAMANKIPIRIKNTFNPGHPGTLIKADSSNGKLVKGISSMKGINLINVQGGGLLGLVGFSRRLFGALAEEKINVILISQASSEHSVCIAVDGAYSQKAKAAIEHEFRYEMRDDLVDEVKITTDLAIIAVVGDGMKHIPGTSGRMFSALGKNGINVSAIAQGSSERNISAVIKQEDVAKALNTLHDTFFLSHLKTIHLFIVGTGLIGKALIRQVKEQFQKLSTDHHLEVKITGVCNSRKMLFNAEGLPLEDLVERLNTQGEPMITSSFLRKMSEMNLSNSVFVDCTGSEDIAKQYQCILGENISIVTPNKKAASADMGYFKKLKETAHKRGVRFLYETNVGAGLPVISTLNDLLLSGDKIIRIEAVLSGTLNYIFSSFDGSKSFSQVVAHAQEKGYTEPDPRDDLSGMDVARKILILSRETGITMELHELEVENLVPKELREGSAREFMNALPSYDRYFEKRRAEAESKNKKLRYQASLNTGKIKVELNAVGPEHPFYSLSGSDNIILLTTERYHERPMIIRGPGAGAEVTAAGVFADIIRIGNYAG